MDEVVERWSATEGGKGAGKKSQEKAQADATGEGVDEKKLDLKVGEEKVEGEGEKKGGGIAMLLPH